MKEQKTVLTATMLQDVLSSMDPDVPVRVALGDHIFQATSVGCVTDDDGIAIPVIVVGTWSRQDGGDR